MNYINRSYRNFILLLSALAFVTSGSELAYAQTPVGTQISVQAAGTYVFKKNAITVSSPIVTVTVGSLPNFEIHYSVKDSNVVFNDVVKLWLGFTNIGNAPVDTVTIQSILPAVGTNIVSVSNNGSINGNIITWKEFNYPSAKQDSFLIQLKIDTTTIGQAVLPLSAILSWQSKTVNAAQNLIVSNFARLTLINTTTATVVGSGRQIDYQLQAANTGNVKSDSTILIDSISANGTFDHASLTPTSISANKRVVVWNLGTLQPVTGVQNIKLTVQTPPNLGLGQLKNDANIHSSTVSSVLAAEISTPIAPVRPASMNLSVSQEYIWGSTNRDSSDVIAVIADSLGVAIPEGVPVTFSTTLGFFDNGTKTFTTLTSGGTAQTYLISENVNNVVKNAAVTVVAGAAQSGTITGNASVIMYPGAVTGVVRASVRVGSVIQQVPYKGAVAEVLDNTQKIVGSDTTKSDGVFFIPLNKETMTFTLKLFVVDQFGDTLSTSTSMASDTLFDRIAVKILNTISGRLQYATGNSPISVQGVDIYLDSLTATSINKKAAKKIQRISGPYIYAHIQTTKTDDLGRFKFENLQPAIYEVNVDSAKFPNYPGQTIVPDTLDGTFTINLNILVRPNDSLSLAMSAQPSVVAGDTIKYSIKYQNQGNIFHTNAVIVDTLPRYTSLIASPKGSFTSVAFDTAHGIVRWSMDTMAVGTLDSLKLSLAVTRNVPDSTYIVNRSWFSSNLLASQGSQSVVTLVHSAPLITLQNFVLQNKDSVVAGDSVQFEIWYRNAGTDSLRGVKIVDSVLNAGRSILKFKKWTASGAGSDTTVVDSIAVWNIGSIPPGKTDSLTLYMRTDYTLSSGRKIQTTAYILQKGLSVESSSASVILKSNPQFSTFLQVVKSADKNVAEIGDVVTYQVVVTNNSVPPVLMKGLKIIDQLPHAFKYYAKSARYNGAPVEPQSLSNGTILQWSLASVSRDTLKAGSAGILVYQLVLGADAMESQGVNTVYATAKDTVGTLFVSLPSQKQITVQPGVFTDNGLIIGKIFYDDDRNAYQSEGEEGIKGVEIWMEDGTRIVTGDDGKFSLPNVKPGQHVLRVNERTLPPRSELLKGGRDFAGDASSRFVRLPEGGIARANFYVKRLLKDSVYQKVGKVSKTAVMRTGSPNILYLRNSMESVSKSNTVDFSVRINYSGTTWLQRIQVFDELPAGFTYVDGSATFNGRKVSPAISGRQVTWGLGRGSSLFEGVLQYIVKVDRSVAQQKGLESRSYVELMTSDSISIQTDTLITSTTVEKIPFVETSFPVEKLVFNPGKSTLRKNALTIFQPIINLIKKYHFADIMIVGYPDIPVKQGTSPATLQKLAEERANTAVDFLSRRIKLDSTRITACSVFRCDTSKDLFSSMMKTKAGEKIKPRHLEVRVQNYFANGLVTQDTSSNLSAISLIRTEPRSDKDFTDSLSVIPGDELVFKYKLFSNPSASVLDANIIDSTAQGISIGSESFTMNQIPIISAAQFNGVFSSSITPFVKKGKNELEFNASIPVGEQNIRINHLLYYKRMNGFGETTLERSNLVTLYVKGINLSLLENALKNERELAGAGGIRKATSLK